MTSPNNKTISAQRPALSPGAHGRWYILWVVSLAIFFLAVVIWQSAPKSYTAKIVVKQAGRHGQLDERDAIIAAIFQLHEEHAHTGEWEQGHSHSDDHSHDAPDTHHGATEHPHLLVDVASVAGEKQISIWCATAKKDDAAAEAHLLADEYVALVNEPPTHPNAGKRAAAARTALAEAQRQFDQASEQLAKFQRENAEQLRPDNTTTQSPPQPAAPMAIARPNPRWLELQQRLKVLRAAREELLTDKTEHHPQVRDLQWQVEEVEAELAAVAQSVVSELPAAQPAVVERKPSQPSPELLNRQQQLQTTLAAAKKQLAAAQAEFDATREVPAHQTTALAAIAGPAKIVSSQGAGASRSGVFGGALLALVLGAVVAARSRVVREPSTVVSMQRVEMLGIPVAGALTTGDGPALSPPMAINPNWISWLTFACELLIGAIALLLVLSACADWQFAAHLLRDPLSALTDAVNRLW